MKFKLYLLVFFSILTTSTSFSQTFQKNINSEVIPLITDNWQSHKWPYNAYFPLTSDENHRHGVANGHVAASCGPTAFSRLLHYWEFPVQGKGSFSFKDRYDCTYTADFGNTIYEWDKMPKMLNENDSEDTYSATATLISHLATCVNDVYVNGGNFDTWMQGLIKYFRYSADAKQVARTNYTKEEWINIYKKELDNGRPILIGGGTPEGGGHWFICDGYNSSGNFHFIMGWGGTKDGYYDIDNPNGYSVNNKALIDFHPELNGKKLALKNLNGGESLPSNQPIEIKWSSENIDNIRIEFTTDNGNNWLVIHDSFVASLGKITWTTPNTNTDECKVKITDATDINIYDKSDFKLSVKPYELFLTSLNGEEYIIPGELTKISWASTPVENIRIEFTDNNGSSWQEIVSSTPTISENYDWTVTNIESKLCRIRISDVANNSVFDESDGNFEIGKSNNAGGPYAVDEHTILLLHFNDNLKNQSSSTEDGVFHGDNISYSNSVSSPLGKSIKLNNKSYVSITHDTDLDLTGDWTIEMWVYFSSIGGDYLNPTLVSKSDGNSFNYFLWYHQSWKSMKAQYKYIDGDVYSATAYEKITTGKWYHVKYTRDNTNYLNKIIIRNSYLEIVDEKEYNYGEAKSLPLTNTEDLLIGNLFGTSNFYIDGFIDELRISNIVRTFEPRLSITDTDENNNYSMYPNPATNRIYINAPEYTNLTISTNTGKIVLDKMNFKGGEINTSNLSKGVYIINFKNSKNVVTKKLIIK